MKVVVYPFDRDFLPVLKNGDLIKELEIESVVSLKGWGFVNSTVSTYGGRQYVASDSLNAALEGCDCLWLVDSWNQCSFGDYILPAALLAAKKGRKIICTRSLNDAEAAVLREAVTENMVSFSEQYDPYICHKGEGQGLLGTINVPVVTVAGVAENTGKFDTQAALFRYFQQNEYKVCWLSSRREAVLMGAHALPNFLLKPGLTENEKIIAINKYAMLLERAEKPDIFLVGIPGAIALYSKRYSGDFGLLAQEMIQAVTPDVFVAGSPYFTRGEEYSFESLERLAEQRLGIGIDFHVMSPYMIDSSRSMLEKKAIFLTVDEEWVSQRVSEFNRKNLFYIDSETCGDNLGTAVLDALSGGEIEVV
ncbi:MAG: TIGR04066 family peptide maturation system protein [Oscillibacter sp.]|nr:TIGR04066 family peptide maturation system protein [Oscillibacter sp.]